MTMMLARMMRRPVASSVKLGGAHVDGGTGAFGGALMVVVVMMMMMVSAMVMMKTMMMIVAITEMMMVSGWPRALARWHPG